MASTTVLNPVDPFAKGVEALTHGHLFLARTCFNQAAETDRSPVVSSYLGRCLAETSGHDEGIALCRQALTRDPRHPVMYLNLAKALLAVGHREEAVQVLRQGAAIASSPEIIAELERLGIRKPPVFPRLPRKHPLNKYAGLLLSFFGRR